MSNRSFTNEQFIEAVTNSISIRGIIKKLNLKPAGGNYTTVKNLIIELDLNIEHLTGQSSNKGKLFRA